MPKVEIKSIVVDPQDHGTMGRHANVIATINGKERKLIVWHMPHANILRRVIYKPAEIVRYGGQRYNDMRGETLKVFADAFFAKLAAGEFKTLEFKTAAHSGPPDVQATLSTIADRFAEQMVGWGLSDARRKALTALIVELRAEIKRI